MPSQRAVPVLVTWENGVDAAVQPELTDSMAAKIMQSMSASRSDGTLKTYASAWRRFESWCQTNRHAALPAHPTTVAAYLVDAADTFTPDGERAFAPATLSKWFAGISHTHRRSGHISPTDHETVRATLSGNSISPASKPASCRLSAATVTARLNRNSRRSSRVNARVPHRPQLAH
ncbi:hypothetical protein [Rhodococcus globerulus]|uniref:hypothetical protein n=1 Tax=Rhodococcus globerulus TaxID=33008 RepID=UPI003019689A